MVEPWEGIGSSAPKGWRGVLTVARGGPGGSMGTKVVRLDGMTARRKRLKRKHGPSMSFGELVQKLWQPESGALEPKVAKVKQKKPAGRRRRIRKN